uniref:Secreted protein n=1 Tax=Meloidogyne incognita TaxID=6306 RepID=A0A914LEC4_MELIC
MDLLLLALQARPCSRFPCLLYHLLAPEAAASRSLHPARLEPVINCLNYMKWTRLRKTSLFGLIERLVLRHRLRPCRQVNVGGPIEIRLLYHVG